MTTDQQTIFIIDDDPKTTRTLSSLMQSVQYQVHSYDCAQRFLDEYKDEAGCLICDIRLPQMSGLELQTRLNQLGHAIPIIFMTANNDANTAVLALKSGAFDFLVKPFNLDYLLDVVNKALQMDARRRLLLSKAQKFEHNMRSLTPRELEVMRLMAQGRTTKEIARILQISPPTVEVHRGKIKKKLGIRTIVELANKLNSINLILQKDYLCEDAILT